MAIKDDFTINPYTKVIRHSSGTTVYTAVQFYSWLMDTFDEPGYLTYETPISFNTPTSFTMQNRWYLDNGDGSNLLNYIYGGGIDTTGYSSSPDPIYMLDLTSTTDFVSTDKDLRIEDDGTPVGPLLAYLNDYPSNGSARIWVRDTRATPAAIATSSTIAMTTDGGTGGGTANGSSVSGDDIYLNLFTIASFTGSPNPQLYIYQNHPQSGTRTRITEWSNLANFDRDQTTGPASPNLIDVVFPIQLAGTLIDSGNFTTFARQTGDTFTFVESTVASAGRTPIATETAADEVNISSDNLSSNSAGEYYLFYDGATSPTFSAGDVIQNVATGDANPPDWYAEVVSHTAWDTATGYLVLRGLRGTPADTENIFNGGSDSTANVNGTVGDTIVSYDAEGTGPAAGDIGKPLAGATSTAERILRAYQDDGTSGKLLLQVYHTHGAIDGRTYTGTTRDLLYKQFVDNDVVSAASGGTATISVTLDATITPNTLISGYSDVTVAHVNGTVSATGGANLILGERVTWTGGGPAIVVKASSSSITLANVEDETALTTSGLAITGDISGVTATTDTTGGLVDSNTENYNFTLQSFTNPNGLYSVFVEGGSIYETGRNLSDIYAYLQFYVRDGQNISERIIYTSDGSSITNVAAEEYIKADAAYSATKSAPFGTLAGGVFFGAQAVWLQGMRSADNNNIKLTDSGGTLREPFTSITLTISNTRSGDRIAIYLENASTTLPDKDQYTSHATNNVQSGTTIDESATGSGFPNDTPTSGTVIMVDVSASEEHRYRYASFNNTGGSGDDGQLVLTDLSSQDGTSTGGGTDSLVNSGKTFDSGVPVVIGDIVYLTVAGGWGYVTSVATTTLGMTLNSEGNSWASAAYEINQLVVAYEETSPDTFFIPYMDTRETTGTAGSPGTETVDLTYVSDREVIIEVRNVENTTQIVPFKTTGTININGLTQSVIRTEDTVYA